MSIEIDQRIDAIVKINGDVCKWGKRPDFAIWKTPWMRRSLYPHILWHLEKLYCKAIACPCDHHTIDEPGIQLCRSTHDLFCMLIWSCLYKLQLCLTQSSKLKKIQNIQAVNLRLQFCYNNQLTIIVLTYTSIYHPINMLIKLITKYYSKWFWILIRKLCSWWHPGLESKELSKKTHCNRCIKN